MKSICFVNTHYIKNNIGGAEVQMYLLAKAFIANGWMVSYASEDIEYDEIDEGIHLFSLMQGNSAFYEVLSKIDADIYYQRGRKEITYMMSVFCKKNNKKFVYATSMDIDTYWFKNLSRLHLTKPFRYLKNFIPSILGDLRSLRGIRSADLILSQTKEQQKSYKQKLKIDSSIIKKIYPHPSNKKVQNSKTLTVLWMANIKGWKQPELFVKLADNLSHLNCQFIMAGGIQEKKYRSFLDDIKTSNVSFLGRIEYFDSQAIYQDADIFVNTSLDYESEPNTYIESWLNRIPVIALNHNPDNILTEMKIGFHSKTFLQLVEDVKLLVNNEELRTNMGKNAQKYAQKVYTTTNFDDLVLLINKIIK